MTFGQLGEFFPFRSRIKVIDRFSGNILYFDDAPFYRKLLQLPFVDFPVYFVSSEVIDGDPVTVVMVN